MSSFREWIKKHNLAGFVWLLIALVYFTGIFSGAEGILRVFDLRALIGSFGTIAGESPGITGVGGSGASTAIFEAVNMLPAVLVAISLLALVENYGGMRVAQRLLAPILRVLLGISGKGASVIIINWQSSDASAAQACALWESGQISTRERDVLVSYCYVAAATLGMYFSNGAILFEYITVNIGVGLGLIMLMKILSANLMRLYNHFFDHKGPAIQPEQQSPEAAATAKKAAGLIDTFIEGCRSGIRMWGMGIIPGTVLGFIIIQILDITGLGNVIASVFAPIMGLLGLPGEAISVWVTSFFTLSGGCAALVSLFANGIVTGRQITVLMPMIFCVTHQIPFIGRVLSVSKIDGRKYPLVMLIGIFTSFLSGILMNMLA